MLLKLSSSKQTLLIALFLVLLSSCKQSEFYQKQDLAKIAGTEDPSNPSSNPTEASSDGSVPSVVTNPTAPDAPPVTTAPTTGGTPVVSTTTTTATTTSEAPIANTTTTTATTTNEAPIANTTITPPAIPIPTMPMTEPPIVIVPPSLPTVDGPIVIIPPYLPIAESPILVTEDPTSVSNVVTNPTGDHEMPVVTNPTGTHETPVVTNTTCHHETPVITQNPDTTQTPVSENQSVILNDRSEIFTQNSPQSGAVDILWVIDDSGSMGDEQDALGRNFNSFISQFIEKNIDFKMAITTTDATSSRNGKMVGNSGKLTRASANGNRNAFINNFTKWVKVGTRGSGVEQGLKTSVSFTDRYASSFLRKDAYFAVVYISDEEDQSEKKVGEYIEKLQALKENKGMVKAYSIVTVKNYGNQWETIGKRYMKVSEATGGTSRDIKKDFAETLLNMGGSILSLIDSFALSEAPYENKIEVFVDNVKVVSGVSFDPLQRTIKFDKANVPNQGTKIEVRYKVKASVIGAM